MAVSATYKSENNEGQCGHIDHKLLVMSCVVLVCMPCICDKLPFNINLRYDGTQEDIILPYITLFTIHSRRGGADKSI